MKLLANLLLVALACSANATELRPLKYITLPSKKPLTEEEILRLGNLKRNPAQEYAHAYRLFHEYAIVIEDRYANAKKYEKAVAAMSKFAKDRCWSDFYTASPSRCKQARENVYLGLNPYCQIVNGGLLYEPYIELEKSAELRRKVQATISDFGLSIPNAWSRAIPVKSEDDNGWNDNFGLSLTQIRYREAKRRISGMPIPDKPAKVKNAARAELQFGIVDLEAIKKEARENGEEWPEYED